MFVRLRCRVEPSRVASHRDPAPRGSDIRPGRSLSHRRRGSVAPAASIQRAAPGLGAVLAGLLASQAADATIVSRAGGTLVVLGEGTEPNRISIVANVTTYTVSDSGVSSMTAFSGCTGTGPVTCTSITAGFVVDGGAGGDEVTVSADDNGTIDGPIVVQVTLDDVANDGSSGELDNVTSSVEDVLGGSGADSLTAAPFEPVAERDRC
jgi:hypothetical protein